METNTQIAEGPADAEPDSIDIEALRKARLAEFTKDLGLTGPSRYIPIPRALLEYDTEHQPAA